MDSILLVWPVIIDVAPILVIIRIRHIIIIMIIIVVIIIIITIIIIIIIIIRQDPAVQKSHGKQ